MMPDKNNQDAFLAVLNAHKGILYKVSNAYCARPEDRNDLVQEIIVELWRAYSGFDATRAQFSTWMYRIALNVRSLCIVVKRGAFKMRFSSTRWR